MKNNSQKQFTIFIVEDEPFFANLMNYDLGTIYKDGVHVFSTGEECLEKLSMNPDVILLDHRLPGLSGLDVLSKIKEYNKDIHVIFLSGQKEAAVTIQAFKQGALDYIQKGENAFEEVRELVGKVLGGNKKESKAK